MTQNNMMSYVIWKGDPQVMGAGIKMRAMEAVYEFLKGTMPGMEYLEGKYSVLVNIPAIPGDDVWIRKNCLGEGDIVGSTSLNDSRQRADRCIRKYNEKRGDQEYVGFTVLSYYLNHFYMKFDVWGPDDDEEED